MISCADRAWAQGIGHEISNTAASLSLTVGGGAATTVTAAEGVSGILLRAGRDAGGDLTLTVGSGGAVAIVEDAGPSFGIVGQHYGSGSLTLDVRDTVTIGSQAAPILDSGIVVDAFGGGAASVTNGAAIHAGSDRFDRGIIATRTTAGSTTAAPTIDNRGDITTAGYGIRVAHETPDASTQTGGVGVTNSGAITANEFGVKLDNSGRGRVTLTNEGDISSATHHAIDVSASVRSGTVSVANSGNLSTAGTTGKRVVAGRHGLQVANSSQGDLSVTNAGGRIVSENGRGICAFNSGAGDVKWSGSFTDRTAAEAATNDDDRIVVDDLASHGTSSLIGIDREVQAERTVRYGLAAGIEVQVMAWNGAADTVMAAGDDPGALADDAARATKFDTGSTDAALKARSDAIVVGEGSALAMPLAAIDTDGGEGLSDDEVAAYLRADPTTPEPCCATS